MMVSFSSARGEGLEMGHDQKTIYLINRLPFIVERELGICQCYIVKLRRRCGRLLEHSLLVDF